MTAPKPRDTQLTCPDCGYTTPRTTANLAAKALARHSCDHQRALQARAARVAARPTTSGTEAPCRHVRVHHEHGDIVRYKVDGCRCRPCRDAHTAYARHRHKLLAYGTWEGLHDATPVIAHLQQLRAAGMGYRRIAELADVDDQLVGRLLFGRRRRTNLRQQTHLSAANARALLAVHPDPLPGAYVPAIGVHRRVQALNAIGWSDRRIALDLGLIPGNFASMMRQPLVTHRRHLDVVALYERLWATTPPQATRYERQGVIRTLNRARKNGYPPPMAWDDDTIDDPNATPAGLDDDTTSRRTVLVEDVADLVHQGATVDAACARLNIKRTTLQRTLYRAGRHDLWRRLTGTDITSDRSA